MSSILSNPKERVRFLRFVGVGLMGAVVDFGTMNLLTRLFNVPLIIAGTISFIAAVSSNFIWNRYWTYPDSRSKPVGRQLVQFGVVSIAGLVIRIPLLAVLEPLFENLFARLSISLPYMTANSLANNSDLAVAVIVVMFWNFFVNRFWTYNDVTS